MQECIVVSFGGNAHVGEPIPGSERGDMNSLRMFEFGKQLQINMFSYALDKQNSSQSIANFLVD